MMPALSVSVPASAAPRPTPGPISVVVPVFNEERSVGALVDSLASQRVLPTEVVFVDAGSTDHTADLIERKTRDFACSVRVLRRGRLNPGQARNEGVRSSSSPWLALADAGIVLDPGWLRELLSAARESGAEVVFGAYEPVCDTFFRCCAALAYVAPRNDHGTRGPSVASMALTREAFERTGGFPPFRAAEDLVFIEALLRSGLRRAFAPRAIAWWETAPDLASTFRRFSSYSSANLGAGRGRYWHRGVARQYALLAVAMLCCVAWLGVGAASVVPLAWLTARVVRAAWAKRGSLPFSTLSPGYWVGAGVLLLAIDLATVDGAVRWTLDRTRGESA